MSKIAIGIDIGTSKSVVGVYIDGKVEIVSLGDYTPSYVAFTDTERLIGEEAKKHEANNVSNTLYATKRLIGRKFDDPSVQSDMKHWPFKVVLGEGGRPKMKVLFKGEETGYFAEDISGMFFKKMKETAEDFLCGQTVTNAVVTVPTYFDDSRRHAIINAGNELGLKKVEVINESTAAAIAYGLDKKGQGERHVLIFDLGGGILEVSVITSKDGVLFVKSTVENNHLGGEDFDNQLVKHCVEEFKLIHKKDHFSSDPRALRRLRTHCERVKCALSDSTDKSFSFYHNDIKFGQNITRTCFEKLCSGLFNDIMVPVKKALDDAKMDKSQIHDILLVGGSTRIPKVQKLLSDFFGKEPNKSINLDEAVAFGATVRAGGGSSGLPTGKEKKAVDSTGYPKKNEKK